MTVKTVSIRKKVFLNSKTGQPSITLPKKEFLKFFKRMPKEVIIVVRPVRW